MALYCSWDLKWLLHTAYGGHTANSFNKLLRGCQGSPCIMLPLIQLL